MSRRASEAWDARNVLSDVDCFVGFGGETLATNPQKRGMGRCARFAPPPPPSALGADIIYIILDVIFHSFVVPASGANIGCNSSFFHRGGRRGSVGVVSGTLRPDLCNYENAPRFTRRFTRFQNHTTLMRFCFDAWAGLFMLRAEARGPIVRHLTSECGTDILNRDGKVHPRFEGGHVVGLAATPHGVRGCPLCRPIWNHRLLRTAA